MSTADARPSLDFIRAIVAEDARTGKHEGRVVTRFPPEPSGYLHLGHAMAICLDFGIAAENEGACHLRMDDTNPCKEEEEFQESIKADIAWLGFEWGDRLYHASDYFPQLHDWGRDLIKAGKAYVCSLSPEEMKQYRGTLTEAGRSSPYRERSVEENLDLFARMKAGEFPEGAHLLRAKIDMASPNMNMRDPAIYRILHAEHHRSGKDWCIYPMYDFAHALSDSIEGITHSLCTLEFEDHRPLYEWFLQNLDVPSYPRQIEFARLNVSYTVVGKRKLRRLVEDGHVTGWDDPRMPTVAGMRRRGYTPESIRRFCSRVGVAKREKIIDLALLEHTLREDLNKRAPRYMGVLRPLRVVIENYPDHGQENASEELDAVNNPEDPAAGTRKIPFSRVLYIEREDFAEDPPKKFFRLAPGREVRLRYAYFITCTGVVKDEGTGEIVEVRCTYDPATRGGDAPDGRKVKGTLHWVSADHAVEAEVRLYDRLFDEADPEDDSDFMVHLHDGSLETLTGCRLEPALVGLEPGSRLQLERLGYFCVDPDSAPGAPVLNRTVTLRDSWAKIANTAGASS